MHKSVEAPPAWGIPPKTYKMVYATFPYLFLFRVMARERFTNFTIKMGILLLAPREMTFVKIYWLMICSTLIDGSNDTLINFFGSAV